MSRERALLTVLTSEPTSTSDLYDRVGYATLARVGLIPYQAFRAELAKLQAGGTVISDTGRDGTTLWRLAPERTTTGPSP
jgi:hypothetical protein